MRFLCACAGGNWRSQHLAILLKDYWHQEAIAVGLATGMHEDTLGMLYAWADKILVAGHEVINNVPEKWRYKVLDFDVGLDTYTHPSDRLLLGKLVKYLEDTNIAGAPVPQYAPNVKELRDLVN